MADLALRSRRLKDYSHLSERLPYRFENRVARLAMLFDLDGPLKPYGEEAMALVNEVNRFRSLRQMMAHGLTTARIDGGAVSVEFRRIEEEAKVPRWVFARISLDGLHEAASDISEFSRKFYETFRRIYLELGLEEDDVVEVPMASDLRS